MAILPSLETRIAEVAADNVSGATPIAKRAAAAFLHSIDPQLAVSDSELSDSLADLAYALARAQPTMAPILNLCNRVLQTTRYAHDMTELRGQIRNIAGAFMNQLDTSTTRIALHAEQLFTDNTVALTHSNSSAIKKALLRAKESGKNISVICTESRPMLEGVDLAKDLGQHDIHTTLIADAAVPSMLSESTMIMVGADSVSIRGLVNKIGTSGFALAAREKGIPLYALCGSEKFIPAAFVVVEKTKPAGELLSEKFANVSPRNVYFDTTPLKLIEGIITEEGIHSVDEIKTTLDNLESEFALRPDILGPPFS